MTRPTPHLAGGASAVDPDVGVADVLATGTFGIGLPQPTPTGHTGGLGLAPMTQPANSRIAKKRLSHHLPAGSTHQSV
jgi:hypothetical protein